MDDAREWKHEVMGIFKEFHQGMEEVWNAQKQRMKELWKAQDQQWEELRKAHEQQIKAMLQQFERDQEQAREDPVLEAALECVDAQDLVKEKVHVAETLLIETQSGDVPVPEEILPLAAEEPTPAGEVLNMALASMKTTSDPVEAVVLKIMKIMEHLEGFMLEDKHDLQEGCNVMVRESHRLGIG